MNIKSTRRAAPKAPKPHNALREPGLIVSADVTVPSGDETPAQLSFHQEFSAREFSFYERNYSEIRALKHISQFAAGGMSPVLANAIDGIWFVIGAAATLESLARDTPDYTAAGLAGADFLKDFVLAPVTQRAFGMEMAAPGAPLTQTQSGQLFNFAASQTLSAIIKHGGKLYYGDLRASLPQLPLSPYPKHISKRLQPELHAASKAYGVVNTTFGLLSRALTAQETDVPGRSGLSSGFDTMHAASLTPITDSLVGFTGARLWGKGAIVSKDGYRFPNISKAAAPEAL